MNLIDIKLSELKQFEEVYWDGEIWDMDDFMNWCWANDIDNLKFEIKPAPGNNVILEIW